MMATGGQAEHPLDGVRADDLNVLQQEDEILAATSKAADGEQGTAGEGFHWQDGILYQQWTPLRRATDTMTIEQLVLPFRCRKTVLQVAHQFPMAGHLGKRTADRVRQRFYWLSLFHEFYRACGKCQKC